MLNCSCDHLIVSKKMHTYVLLSLRLWFHWSRHGRIWCQYHPRRRKLDTRTPATHTLPGETWAETCCCHLRAPQRNARCEGEGVRRLSVRSATCSSVVSESQSQVVSPCVRLCLPLLLLSVSLTFYWAAGPLLSISTPHSLILHLSLLLHTHSPPLSSSPCLLFSFAKCWAIFGQEAQQCRVGSRICISLECFGKHSTDLDVYIHHL